MRRATPSTTTFAMRSGWALCAVGSLVGLGGCYNGQTLVDRTRADARRSRIEEVDLGQFNVTMPRDDGELGRTEVQLHPFGTTVRYKVADTERLIEQNEYLLRHAVVLTVRDSKLEEFAEPDLTTFRDRLLAAVRGALDDKAIESIGFHEVRFIRH